MRAECSTAKQKSVRSPYTSASRSNHKGALKKKAVTLRDRAGLKQELEDFQMSAEAASEVFHLMIIVQSLPISKFLKFVQPIGSIESHR